MQQVLDLFKEPAFGYVLAAIIGAVSSHLNTYIRSKLTRKENVHVNTHLEAQAELAKTTIQSQIITDLHTYGDELKEHIQELNTRISALESYIDLILDWVNTLPEDFRHNVPKRK